MKIHGLRSKGLDAAFMHMVFCWYFLALVCISSLDGFSSMFGDSGGKSFFFADAALTHQVSYTVAGIAGTVGDKDGYPGTSLMVNPTALCASPLNYNGNEPGQVAIGSKNSFRTLNVQSWDAGYWFGQPPAVSIPTTGNISTVSVSNPYGCETSASVNSTFFVQGDGNLYIVLNATSVSLYQISSNLSFVDLAYYNESVYVISISQILFQCKVSGALVSACTQITLQGITENSAGQVGLSVSSDGLFVATGAALRRFSLTGGSIASISVPAVALHFMVERPDVLLAATLNAVYTVEWNATNPLEVTLIAGSPTSSTTCSTLTDYDASVTFCGIYRIFPIAYSSIFISTPSLATVRLLSFPDIKIIISFNFPFADGMIGAESNVSAVYDALNKAIHDSLSAIQPPFPSSELPFIRVNQSDTTIFPGNTSWMTNVTVQVPQTEFTGMDMEKAIAGANQTEVRDLTEDYYSETDFIVFTDSILVDLANATTKFVVSNASAFASRSALHYPLIYSTLPDQSNPSETADYANYDLFIKLLMPAVFSKIPPNTANSTTGSLLSAVSFATVIVEAMKEAYAHSQQGLLSFPESVYHISQYSALEQQAIRLRLLAVLDSRFDECADSQLPNLHNYQTGISNRTLVDANLNNGVAVSEYSVFVPDLYTGLDVQKCIDDTDWSGLNDWLNNLRKSNAACGQGCTIAIAVIVAVIIIIVIILLIVFVSKRRRLAVVVAPKPPQKPQFVSTVDLDNLDDDYTFSNPLA